MLHTCTKCSRVNPAEALYCYYDGIALNGGGVAHGPVNIATQAFPAPFIFPSGRSCANFDQLALACQEEWPAALDLLKQGFLVNFLSGLGRADLAQSAREAVRSPNPDRGLDDFLARLPAGALKPPQISIEPTDVNVGEIKVGEDRKLTLRLVNQGGRLLHGSIASKVVWLSFGEAGAAQQKLFQFRDELVLPIYVRGKRLAARNQPLEGQLVIESNGGNAVVAVRCTVPVKPFSDGMLSGAASPRQLAEKAKLNPREAAAYFDNGSVSRWYSVNGWDFPIKGPLAAGLGGVQQYFEANGLVKPPKVGLNPTQVALQGKVGEPLRQMLELRAQEKRFAYAVAASDQPWLTVECPASKGQLATVDLIVKAVPDQPGETLQAKVTVRANGNQKFVVPVALAIAGKKRPPGVLAPSLLQGLAGGEAVAAAAPLPQAIPMTAAAPDLAAALAAATAAPPAFAKKQKADFSRHLIPAGVLALVLLGLSVRDMFLSEKKEETPAETEQQIDDKPRLVLRMHDELTKDRIDTEGYKEQGCTEGTMRFGLVAVDPTDPSNPKLQKKLTYDLRGRSNNTCIRIDERDYLFGHPPGKWNEFMAPLGKNTDEKDRPQDGYRSTWNIVERNILVTQTVEIVRGPVSQLYDTCLITYTLENRDSAVHRVGLRFLLDTYIGGNDGVPFTLPGSKKLCDTQYEFDTEADVPDFIQALEKGNLKNHGTIAHVQFRLGGRIEKPQRVTLGAWPAPRLRDERLADQRFWEIINGHMTGWNVPVMSMQTMMKSSNLDNRVPDSAVAMYWEERNLQPGKKRVVGFSYGLGNVSSSKGGELLLTMGGSFEVGDEFTVTALVNNPTSGQTVTLNLPEGLQLVGGAATQNVPLVAEDATRRQSPVTWKVRSEKVGKHEITVESSTGVKQKQKVIIKEKGSIFR